MGLGDKWKKQAEEASIKREEKLAELKRKQVEAEANLQRMKEHKAKMKSNPDYAQRAKKDSMGLDFDSYTDEQLSQKNMTSIDLLQTNPATKVAMDLATTLAGASTRDLYAALRGQIEQNWIIIRQNEQIVRELKKLNQK